MNRLLLAVAFCGGMLIPTHQAFGDEVDTNKDLQQLVYSYPGKEVDVGFVCFNHQSIDVVAKFEQEALKSEDKAETIESEKKGLMTELMLTRNCELFPRGQGLTGTLLMKVKDYPNFEIWIINFQDKPLFQVRSKVSDEKS
jgi:hypothetical protein